MSFDSRNILSFALNGLLNEIKTQYSLFKIYGSNMEPTEQGAA